MVGFLIHFLRVASSGADLLFGKAAPACGRAGLRAKKMDLLQGCPLYGFYVGSLGSGEPPTERTLPGGSAMNGYKIRYIVEFIRRSGPLPRDVTGSVLSSDDLLAWYGLKERLTLDEQAFVKKELNAMAEAEVFVEQLRLGGR